MKVHPNSLTAYSCAFAARDLGALRDQALRSKSSTTLGLAALSRTRSPRTLPPQSSFSTDSGSAASAGSRSSSATNTCRYSPLAGAVAIIFPLTRNDVYSKCGSSVTSGRDIANRRASASFIGRTGGDGFDPAGHAVSRTVAASGYVESFCVAFFVLWTSSDVRKNSLTICILYA